MYARIAVFILLLVSGFELSVIVQQNVVVQRQRILLWEMVGQLEANLVPCHSGSPLPRIEWFNANPVQSVSDHQRSNRSGVASGTFPKLVYGRDVPIVEKYTNQTQADKGR